MPRKTNGVGLVVGGALIATLFLIFIFVAPTVGSSAPTPMWLGVIWGSLAVAWGLFRLIAGPSSLDRTNGGTDVGA